MRIHMIQCSVPPKVSKVFGSVITFKNDFVECFTAYREFRKKQVIDLGDVVMMSNEGYPVYCNDMAVCTGGVPRRLPGAISTKDSEGNDVIVINKRLLEEAEWFIEAVLQHESGHIKLHTITKRNILNDVVYLFTTPKAEYEADEYAMSSSHMLCTLKRMKELGFEVDDRIAHLEMALEMIEMDD